MYPVGMLPVYICRGTSEKVYSTCFPRKRSRISSEHQEEKAFHITMVSLPIAVNVVRKPVPLPKLTAMGRGLRLPCTGADVAVVAPTTGEPVTIMEEHFETWRVKFRFDLCCRFYKRQQFF